MLKILFLGDVFAKPGREVVRAALPGLKRLHAPDLVIANGENLAHAAGVTQATLQELFDAGVDVVTGGNHSLANKQGLALFSDEHLPLLRPMNLKEAPGRGSFVINKRGIPVLVVSLMGQVFMKEGEMVNNPFQAIDGLLSSSKNLPAVKFVDFHAEATGEKVAMGAFLDGKVSAVVGTHTHVQTADVGVLTGGTAYVSDAGMCGPKEGVIGFEQKAVLEGYLGGFFGKAEPELKGPRQVNGVLLEIDEITGKTERVELVNKVFA